MAESLTDALCSLWKLRKRNLHHRESPTSCGGGVYSMCPSDPRKDLPEQTGPDWEPKQGVIQTTLIRRGSREQFPLPEKGLPGLPWSQAWGRYLRESVWSPEPVGSGSAQLEKETWACSPLARQIIGVGCSV